MNRRSIAIATLGACGVCGCATAPSSKIDSDASFITYQLPVTAAQLVLDATLTSCGSTPKAKGTIAITPIVKASPYEDHIFKVEGSNLASFTKKREIKIDLYPNGAIKSINSSVSDRTGAIIGNVIKLISTVAMADAPTRTLQPGMCNGDTKKALGKVDSLKLTVRALQQKLLDRSADQAAIQKKIEILTAEVARIQGDQLTIKLTRTIDFAKSTRGGIVRWKAGELAKWIDHGDNEADVQRANFQVGWCVSALGKTDPVCNTALVTGFTRDPSVEEVAPIACRTDGSECRATLVFREPTRAVMTAVALDVDLGKKPDETMAQIVFPMAQWGEVSYLPLSVGFGGSKSVAIALDEFGARTSFGWSSGARGEEIVGGVQSVVDAAVAFKAARDGEDLRSDKAQIEALEAQQKLNKLRKCQAILDAGGFVCPES